MSVKIKRSVYADMFGPTTGDRVRLADTDLIIEVEKDFTDLRRGGEIRRRQGDPRRHGAIAGHQQAGRGRYRHHQCADRRPLGHRQGRRRHQGRLYQRHRQGRQSRHPARRDHRDRPRHRRDRGRGQDPHRRRVRQPHPFHLPAADRARADVRRHLDAGRRHRPVARHLCHHLHARPLAHGADDPVVRCLPGQSRHFRQGQRLAARRAGRDDQGRRLCAETARGLGHHAGGDRQLSFRRRRLRRPGHDPFRHAERIGLRRGHRKGVQGPHHPRLPHRRRRRRPCARHHQDRRA